MRTLLIICTLIFTSGAMAQSPLLSRAFNEATAFAGRGEFEKAAKGYKTSLIIASDEDMPTSYLGKIHYNLGVCSYRLRKPAEASIEFDRAIKLSHGKYQRAFYGLGMARMEQKDWPAARHAFLEALKQNGSDGETWFDIAVVYLAEQDYENAEHAFRQSIVNKSVDAALGHNNIGVIMAMKSDLVSAEKEFEAALIRSG
ncbi:MAG: tetratricopeptide repeat protein, partial [Pyrinomonadaceae bacterium]